MENTNQLNTPETQYEARLTPLQKATIKYKAKKREERRLECLRLGIPFRTHKWRKRLPGEADDEFRKRWFREYHAINKDSRNQSRRQSYPKRKDALLAKQRADYAANPEKFLESNRKWRKTNPEKFKASNSEYVKRNRKKRTAQQCNYIRERRKRDPQFRILFRLRSRMYDALKPQSAKKAASTLELLGCTAEKFKLHLESEFTPEMSWDNYGKYWQIDHVSPLAAFDLTKPHMQKLAFHWSNCRPLDSLSNNLKADRVLQLHELLDL